MWTRVGNLSCTTVDCPNVFEGHGRDKAVVADAARAKGWHLYWGKTMSGRSQTVHLCPKCIGTNRSKLPKPPPSLEGDLPLWE